LELSACVLDGSKIGLGAQDCALRQDGAFTGDVSATMLRDVGCSYVILGHSERREYHHEQDHEIATKIALAHMAGLKVILCVGEKDRKMSREERVTVLKIQLRNSLPPSANAENTVIAYEPVWAIGSGLTPTHEHIADTHTAIRTLLPDALRFGARVLYGGSVNAKNAAEILSLKEVDGALVGGASLKLEDFTMIVQAAG
jgi:triosephosphate isomerase